jgi:hypothetical protein
MSRALVCCSAVVFLMSVEVKAYTLLADVPLPDLSVTVPTGTSVLEFQFWLTDGGSGPLLQNSSVVTYGAPGPLHLEGTFGTTAAYDPAFSTFAAALMNGVDDQVVFTGGFVALNAPNCMCYESVPVQEFDLFGGHDFAGHVITLVDVEVESLDAFFGGFNGGASATLNSRLLIFEGEPLPEPRTAWLTAMALVAIAGLRARRSRYAHRPFA